MSERLGPLMEAATKAAEGMGKVAGAKPDETPLQSDARTFRGIATMLTTLSAEAREHQQTATQLRRILQRIAMLEVRGGADLVERGDWRSLVEEVQAMAQDVLNGNAPPRPRG